MTVAILFEFEERNESKEPVYIPAEAAALVPRIGDRVESDNQVEHVITACLFDWAEAPGPSILLRCRRPSRLGEVGRGIEPTLLEQF